MNKEEAIKATRNGAIAACISAVVTLGVVLIAISADKEGSLALWNNPLNFLDVAVIVICAFGMYKKSRVASILIFIYFVAAKVSIAVETQSVAGIGTGLIFLYFFGRAIQGSFVYHKFEKENNPDYQASTKWAFIIGIPSVAIIVALVGVGLFTTIGILPSTKVQSANEIFRDDITTLKEAGIISGDDKVRFFYSEGFSSILEGGNILTQDRVISYYTDEKGELYVYEVPFGEITDVVLESQGNLFEDSVYRVNTNDPDRWLRLFLSIEQKGDEKFVVAMRDSISN